MDDQDAQRWLAAGSLSELGELTARWLEGRIPWYPLNAVPGGPDDETGPLIPVLVSVNRAGFVTDFSQPGIFDGEWRQRAAVSGFADGAVLERIIAAVMGTEGLRLIVHTADVAGTADGAGVVVSIEGEREHTWAGLWCDRVCLAQQWWRTGAVGELWWAWQITVVDLVWGRNDVLWPLLSSVAGVL